jgi:hypothetical protein
MGTDRSEAQRWKAEARTAFAAQRPCGTSRVDTDQGSVMARPFHPAWRSALEERFDVTFTQRNSYTTLDRSLCENNWARISVPP